jgi:hypothetical protein
LVKKYRVLESRLKDLVEELDLWKNKGMSLEKNIKGSTNDQQRFENEINRLNSIIL